MPILENIVNDVIKRKYRRKGMILFVHGFGSSHKCWKKLIELLSGDEQITAQYELNTWDYPTKWVELNLLGRIPRLKEIGRSLGDEIDSPKYRGRELTLVGHSQGGLVIQSYFAELLNGKASKLRDLRQAIFFATPNQGSTTGISLRRLMSTLFRNPQETALRVFNPDVSDMRAIIRERIVAATDDSENKWRVPIHAFCGMQDNIVPEASARGPFDRVKHVRGTHFSIIKPEDNKDPRYTEFAELLLDPGGHAHRFEIESYETIITVEPRGKETIRTTSEKNPRTVEFESFATLRRTVRFSAINHCTDPFTIRYGTRNDGYVVGHTSHANKASPVEKGRWEDTGTSFVFKFTPEYDRDFCLNVEIYKGFDENSSRNVHFHLGNHSKYRRMKYVLDLSAYVKAGYNVSGPSFYLHPEDHEHGELCQMRGARQALEMLSGTPEGEYHWELQDLNQGIVDIVWDVSRVEEPGMNTPTIRLGEGEAAVVGYGSLLSAQSIGKTLGREYDGPFIACHIEGWRRSWDVSMPNRAFYYEQNGVRVYPEKILYLNVRLEPGAVMNCVMFVLNSDELEAMDDREWIYDRQVVTGSLRGVCVEGGDAIMYVAREKHVVRGAKSPREAAVRASYLRILEHALQRVDPVFRAEYEHTTEPVPEQLMIKDTLDQDRPNPWASAGHDYNPESQIRD